MSNRPLSNTTFTVNVPIIILIIVGIIATNMLLMVLLRSSAAPLPPPQQQESSYKVVEQRSNGLYLLDQAGVYVKDTRKFERKVRKIARKLRIPPEWLMAVMYSESKFDASALNKNGNGAVGLIQWQVGNTRNLGITTEQLRNLNHLDQLDYVYQYFNQQQKQFGEYKSITDLYLSILYPPAVGKEFCYNLYGPSDKGYEQNKILDENKDGVISVKDIDDRMKRMFKTAYLTSKKDAGWSWTGWLW